VIERQRPPGTARATRTTEVVVLGAHGVAMWRRLGAVERILMGQDLGATRLTMLVARRPVAADHPRAADGTLDDLIGRMGRFPAVDGWRAPDAGHRGHRSLAELAPTEAELALLLLSRRWGMDVGPARAALMTEDRSTSVELDLPLPAIGSVRSAGLRRVGEDVAPTTEGTLRDWLQARMFELETTSCQDERRSHRPRAIVVTTQPHRLRTRMVVARLDRSRGLAIEVVAAPGPRPLPARTALGEARSLLREVRTSAKAWSVRPS
jgi:hypothetical protein